VKVGKLYTINAKGDTIWDTHELVFYLYECLNTNSKIVIDLNLEGFSCKTKQVFYILESFCKREFVDPSTITIQTGNLLEKHNNININIMYKYWYELPNLQKWIKTNKLTNVWDFSSSTRIGNFNGRSTWYRLWIAAYLYTKYNNKIIQTFHSSLKNNYVTNVDLYNTNDFNDFEALNNYRCEHINMVGNFLYNTPIVLDKQDIHTIQNKACILKTTNNGYPIQHPANMNILTYYKNIFVDIVCETVIDDNAFFITEKTWRCIIAKKPFILMSSLNSLQNLKNLGFKTFNELWDEGYDEYSHRDRVIKILELIDQIVTWDSKEYMKKLHSITDILEHNYCVFQNLSYSKLKSNMEYFV